MKITVRVTTRAARDEVIQQGDVCMVRVRAIPKDGEANEAVIRLLAKHFGVGKMAIHIVSGHSARDKIVEIGRT